MIEAIIYRLLTRVLIVDLIRRLIYIRPGSTAIHSSEDRLPALLGHRRVIIYIVLEDKSYVQIGRSYINNTVIYVMIMFINKVCMYNL